RGYRIELFDFDRPAANDFLAVNQFTVREGQEHRRADIVVFVNGLPLALLELKNPAAEEADAYTAYKQIQTYKLLIPSLLAYNELCVISDGLDARIGSLTAPFERFAPWRTIDGKVVEPLRHCELEVLLRGVFEPERLLDLVRHFIVFEDDGEKVEKKLAAYHQFHAARLAVRQTVAATRPEGDRKVGVVWHTQGAGKSLTMAFYAGKVVLEPAMANPTIVVITDRNDLDDQLFGTFSRCKDLLRQAPIQAEDRADLRRVLCDRPSGGVIFTTLQKFLPDERGGNGLLLSDRRNIIVCADEAHRSQYGFAAKMDTNTGELRYGLAKLLRDALPNASFIGFTGTPIEEVGANTREVFGDYLDVYDLERAVEDHATVPIYYESRLAMLDLDEAEKPNIDPEFEEVTEAEEIDRRERLKSKWAALEALVGADKRLRQIAEDLVAHFEARLEAMDGKAMVVCMSRRISVGLHDELVRLRPDWFSPDDSQGALKVVMTGSATDPPEWQQHIRNKRRREDIAKRFKNPDDPLRMVIVRDMWLTGFDVPCLHTMYLDKPMRGHGLMQAIARVNRVFRDKPGGLVVDYLGLADSLRDAMAAYTQSGGRGETTIDVTQAVAVMLEKYEVCCDLFHGFDYSKFATGTPAERITMLPQAQEHVLSQANGRDRLLQVVGELSRAFALAVPRPEAIAIREEVAFFQAVKAAVVKTTGPSKRTQEQMDHAVRQIVSKAIVSEGVIDIFEAAGLPKPDISILSDEFLAEVRGMPQKNLAVELLRKLLNDELRSRQKTNLVQARSFAEMLEKSVLKYKNRAIETAQVIEEMIAMAKDMRAADRRGDDLRLTEAELAFYDALEVSDSAVAVMGDEALRAIAVELARLVRQNTTIDWAVRESARANLRRLVRRLLRQYGYPPDKQEKATRKVLAQAELMAGGVATEN
ncbi:MAG: type I restriction endonuclease subunit R, partial [Armatimonadetes bacterium]|nr:type I restriction endonuclease subunit R [Armatimonadota bacterium]